jgi:hypothetical protein
LEESHKYSYGNCDFHHGHRALGLIVDQLVQADEQQRTPGNEVLEFADPVDGAEPVIVEKNSQGGIILASPSASRRE